MGIKELIQFQNVNVYRKDKLILQEVNLTLHNAELIFIVGGSGSGKSSLLKSIYGALPIEGKQAAILDHDLLEIKRRDLQQLRRKLGLIFQDYKIFERLSVFENLNYFLRSINYKDAVDRKRRIDEILDKVGLTNKSHDKGYQLSGGEKQRLGIARALIHAPQIIIADEPTGNLNKSLGVDIFKLLRALALDQGTSILAATHDEQLPNIFSAKIFHCNEGRLIGE